ncbi:MULTISPECIES: exopolysaccharide biosynthesis polyprenyl glycosylphosphotransferase [Bradyrhizobium]|uniref:exopolysaccharide biosynthesis polyprenyl glycosylphosphotransferase n=1 Tax=Bradyrhizobium TaxID=374 RepID=UPI001EDB5D40|nr:exopolysaccharide biosynthesis polyprenyl glycosylphosphotransferase [Bradyrhizobium zhengyangense]MCG2643797.1 exopolysaccharide biosynthesis polyprenyl glycosylphosphotransferase [Bradyrhizobium zhengyangense]
MGLRLLILEFVTVAAAAYLASKLYHAIVVPDVTAATRYFPAALLLATLYCFGTLWLGDTAHLLNFRRRQLLWNAVRATVLAFCFLLSGMFLLKTSDEYSRGAFFAQLVAVWVATLAMRGILIRHQERALGRGRLALRRAFLVGDPAASSALSKRLAANGVVTIAQFPLASLENDQLGPSNRKLIDACRSLAVDEIFILPKPSELESVRPMLDQMSQLPVAVHVLVPELDGLLSSSEISAVGDVATMKVQGQPLSAADELLKRAFDLVVGTSVLMMFTPLMLMIAGLIKLTSPGPIFFRQARHGFNNQAITVLKFRTMRTSTDDNGGEFRQATRSDNRVTWVGARLRASSLDELPQLLNVLRGEMSLVGPRPHALAHNQMFEERIPPLSRRHNVKPGITGWAQVNLLRGETDTLEKMQKRIDFDLFYIDNWSFYFDLKILALTALMFLSIDTYKQSY